MMTHACLQATAPLLIDAITALRHGRPKNTPQQRGEAAHESLLLHQKHHQDQQ